MLSSGELLFSSSYCLSSRFLLCLSIFCLARRAVVENSSPVSHKRRMDFLSALGLKGKQGLPGGSGERIDDLEGNRRILFFRLCGDIFRV